MSTARPNAQHHRHARPAADGAVHVFGLRTERGLDAGRHQLETGADRVDLPTPSPEAVAAAEAYARRLGAKTAADARLTGLQRMGCAPRETVYLIDVRTREITPPSPPGLRWFPGGQAVQRSDEVAVVKHAPIVFACDRMARATLTPPGIARWLRRWVYAVAGGTSRRSRTTRAGAGAPDGVRRLRHRARRGDDDGAAALHPTAAGVIFVARARTLRAGPFRVLAGCREGGSSSGSGTSWRRRTRRWSSLHRRQRVRARGRDAETLCYQHVSVLEGGMEAWRRRACRSSAACPA